MSVFDGNFDKLMARLGVPASCIYVHGMEFASEQSGHGLHLRRVSAEETFRSMVHGTTLCNYSHKQGHWRILDSGQVCRWDGFGCQQFYFLHIFKRASIQLFQ